MKNRSFFLGTTTILAIILLLPLIIFSQQGKSASRVNSIERPVAGRTSSTGIAPVTTAVIKHDLNDALSIIQQNYIDGSKLDYNSIFKSSSSRCIPVVPRYVAARVTYRA